MAKIIKTSSGKSKKVRRARALALSAILLALLLVIGALVYKNLNARTDTRSDQGVENTVRSSGDNVDTMIGGIVYEANRDGYTYEQTYEAYGKTADKVESAEDKQAVLLKQASYAYSQGQSEQAWAAALKADEVYSNNASRSMLAIYAELRGDKSLALEYYKKILASYEKNPPTNAQDLVRLKEKIKELGG